MHVCTANVHVPALPLTVRPPDAPVLLRTMPLAAPFAAMLRKVRPLAPMFVFVPAPCDAPGALPYGGYVQRPSG